MPAPDRSAPPTVHLFTDIEGSTGLWETEPERMRSALAAHDALARGLVQAWGGRVVKTTGDGLHAVFEQADRGVSAAVALQRALADPVATGGLLLPLRCGLHAGADEARDNDFYGRDVNRAARIMAVAHGGQVLVSARVVAALAARPVDGLQVQSLGTVRLRGLTDAEQVHQVLAPGLRAEFPPLKGLADTPHNLPQALNRFIGREAQLRDLPQALRDHRLVTLWGPGGIGKSRLSLEIGRALLGAFVDGVWLVELAPLSDGARVPQAVAAALGVKEAPGQDLASALAERVRDRQMLLILDNCEHVHGGAAAVAKALLQAGGGLRVLASSRELLHVAGEQAFAVPALSVPGDSAEEALAGPSDPQAMAAAHAALGARLLAHDAVRLFVERAAAAAPAFVLDADTGAAVVAICQRLDGIPLALELAAARVRAMPVQTIATRLADSFKLIATQDRTVPERQRTLQVLIDWSHDLLSPAEQRLLARLSVFAGGFTLAAVEAICADRAADGVAHCGSAGPEDRAADEPLLAAGEAAEALIDTDDVIDLLSQLVDKSLVVADPDHAGYRLLETVRLYAQARCPPAERLGLRGRHLRWYLQLAEQAAPALAAADAGPWLERLDRERANLLAAHAHAVAAQEGGSGPATAWRQAAAFRLGFALLRGYFIQRGLLSTALQMLRATLASPAVAQADEAQRARALFDVGHLCNFLGQPEQARDALAQSLAIVQRLGQTVREVAILQPLGSAHAALGERAKARACFESAIELARAKDIPLQLTSALVCLAQWHQAGEDWRQAEALYREALDLARGQGVPESVATILLNLAMVWLGLADERRALAHASQALALLQPVCATRMLVGMLDLGCALAVAAGDPACARRWLAASDALCQRTGLHRDTADQASLASWRQRLARIQAPQDRAAGSPLAAAIDDEAALLADLARWLAARQQLGTTAESITSR